MNKKNVLTCAGGGGSLLSGKSNVTVSPQASVWMALSAFTMAEILLSLTIIGVVAAITLPSLTGNINERTWNTQRKALYARFSQAIALMPALNGYGTLIAEQTASDGSVTQSAVDTVAETFITEGLSKVLKINNICDTDHLADCGIPESFNKPNGDVISSFPTTLGSLNSGFMAAQAWNSPVYNSLLDTKAAAFETQNGESIAVFYNPSCKADLNEKSSHYVQSKMCANFVYDLNGNKGPNTVGKDIGIITAIYPTDPVVVAPMPALTNAASATQTAASSKCQAQDSEYRLPNREEAAALYYNKNIFGISNGHYWTSSLVSAGNAGKAWRQALDSGSRMDIARSESASVRCIKR